MSRLYFRYLEFSVILKQTFWFRKNHWKKVLYKDFSREIMLSGTRDSFSSTVYKSACLKVGGQYLFICSCVYRIAWSTSRQTWNRFVQEAALVSRLSSVASFCCIRHSAEWSLTPALATAVCLVCGSSFEIVQEIQK